MTMQQAQALRSVAQAIIDTCKDAEPIGAPGGVIYAALMTHGVSLQNYETLMRGLVRAGKVRQDGDCYHWLADLS